MYKKNIFRITFSIPKEKIIDETQQKKKFIAQIIPGILSTYIYDKEKYYYDDYRSSYFAITCEKGGWDCMRHYEIMANGCIPMFINIDSCPNNTLFDEQKKLYKKCNDAYTRYNNNGEACKDYTNNKKATRHINNTYNIEKRNDINHLKKNDIRYLNTLANEVLAYVRNKLYGKGMTYSRTISISSYNSTINENIIKNNIINKTYDIIIYGSCFRGRPFLDLVNVHYNPENIVMLFGEDGHEWNQLRKFALIGYKVFIRELRDI